MGNCSLRAVADTAQEDAIFNFTATNRKAFVEVLPSPRDGVWKVKLVIDPKDLERIFSEEVNTEALIERMRFAANSTPIQVRGKSYWLGEAISYNYACLSSKAVQVHPTRTHLW